MEKIYNPKNLLFKQIVSLKENAYRQCLQLHHDVLRKPLGLSLSEYDKSEDEKSILLGCFNQSRLIGFMMLSPREQGTVQLRQVCILQAYQGQGIGSLLLTYTEKTALNKGYFKIWANVRKTAEPFYRNAGYETQGDPFSLKEIPHVYMQKSLGIQ